MTAIKKKIVQISVVSGIVRPFELLNLLLFLYCLSP